MISSCRLHVVMKSQLPTQCTGCVGRPRLGSIQLTILTAVDHNDGSDVNVHGNTTNKKLKDNTMFKKSDYLDMSLQISVPHT